MGPNLAQSWCNNVTKAETLDMDRIFCGPQAFANLVKMKKALKYRLTIFINIDSDQTQVALCPKSIAGQTVCFAVRLEEGRS